MKTVFKYYILTLAAGTLQCISMRAGGFEERVGTGMIKYPLQCLPSHKVDQLPA